MIKMENKFIKVHSVKDILTFTAFIITGLVLTAIPEVAEAHLGGYALIATGAVLVFFLKSGFKNIETQDIYIKKDFSFPGEMKNSILSALESSPESIDLSKEGKGEVLMLKAYYSKTSNKAYLQLFEYIPYQYKPCSEIYEYEFKKIANILK